MSLSRLWPISVGAATKSRAPAPARECGGERSANRGTPNRWHVAVSHVAVSSVHVVSNHYSLFILNVGNMITNGYVGHMRTGQIEDRKQQKAVIPGTDWAVFIVS